jgi:hypothetical protein
VSEGEAHDAEKISKKYPDLGGFHPDGVTTRRILRDLDPNDPSLSPGRDAKPEVKQEWLDKSSGYAVGDPNRVPQHWEGGEITRVEDIKHGLSASIDSRKAAMEMLSAAKQELTDGLGALVNLIHGAEDEDIIVACETGYETVEKIEEALTALAQSVTQVENYINKL